MCPLHPVTTKFLVILAENKRLSWIDDVADRFQKLYKELNREEKITIISSEPLSSSD